MTKLNNRVKLINKTKSNINTLEYRLFLNKYSWAKKEDRRAIYEMTRNPILTDEEKSLALKELLIG